MKVNAFLYFMFLFLMLSNVVFLKQEVSTRDIYVALVFIGAGLFSWLGNYSAYLDKKKNN